MRGQQCNSGSVSWVWSPPRACWQAAAARRSNPREVYDEAKGTTPTGDAYHQALYSGYMEHATYEQEEMMNYTSAMSHARNAMAAAHGETPAVAGVTDFGPQPADKVEELTQARNQLVAALGDAGAKDVPEAAALAQTYYACWVEQQHENFQPHDIAYCRDGFYKNMAILNNAVIPEAPELVSLQSDVFFDFDKYNLKPAAIAELDKVYPSHGRGHDFAVPDERPHRHGRVGGLQSEAVRAACAGGGRLPREQGRVRRPYDGQGLRLHAALGPDSAEHPECREPARGNPSPLSDHS